jgi:hypothetical protein
MGSTIPNNGVAGQHEENHFAIAVNMPQFSQQSAWPRASPATPSG